MSKPVKIILVVLVYLVGLITYKSFQKNDDSLAPGDPVAARPHPGDLATPALPDLKSDPAVAARVQVLEQQAAYQAKAQRAAQQVTVSRERAAARIQPAWTALMQDKSNTYAALLQKAKMTRGGKATCTICNGLGEMPCVMCKAHPGKCITCGGTGSDVAGELCPTCTGTGKCYLCAGTRKMNCAFCNDGVIDAHGPTPSATVPVH